MNRLQKFVERGVYGVTRIAYVLQPKLLPPVADGMDWYNIGSFSAAEELLNHPHLKSVFQIALQKGSAIVAAQPRGQ
jgi:hypothetical protein